MARPKLKRKISFRPRSTYFKPVGIPLRTLEVTHLTLEEGEALRLKHEHGLNQTESAQKMKTSRSTLQRILRSAYQKIASAIVGGRAIRIIG